MASVEPPPLSLITESVCTPPYDFKNFSNPVVQWKSDPFGPRLEIIGSTYITAEYAGIPMVIEILGRGSDGKEAFSASASASTNWDGNSMLNFPGNPLTTMTGTPLILVIF